MNLPIGMSVQMHDHPSPAARMSGGAEMDMTAGSDTSPGSNLNSGSMSVDMAMGPDLFPTWVMAIWIVALAAVLIFHCGHLVRMSGQHRWFHLSHVVMLIGMIYMYASMAFSWSFISGWLLALVYVATTVAIIVWMAKRFVQKKPFSYLWILALVQQASMIYMWVPMKYWVAWLSYGLTVYFALEALAWLVGLCNDSKPGRGNAVGPGDRSTVMPLGHTTLWSSVSMAIMAASMSYMFLGMQLMT